MMREEGPRLDAEWIMETIVDDYARSFDQAERLSFYARIAELAAERFKREGRYSGDSYPEDQDEV
jgi:hypothetical protein